MTTPSLIDPVRSYASFQVSNSTGDFLHKPSANPTVGSLCLFLDQSDTGLCDITAEDNDLSEVQTINLMETPNTYSLKVADDNALLFGTYDIPPNTTKSIILGRGNCPSISEETDLIQSYIFGESNLPDLTSTVTNTVIIGSDNANSVVANSGNGIEESILIGRQIGFHSDACSASIMIGNQVAYNRQISTSGENIIIGNDAGTDYSGAGHALGFGNTIIGHGTANTENDIGNSNTFIGLETGCNGSDNIILSNRATGTNLTCNHCIYIGSNGTTEDNVTRIGFGGITDQCYVQGIYQQEAILGLPVFCAPNGKLGTYNTALTDLKLPWEKSAEENNEQITLCLKKLDDLQIRLEALESLVQD